jgi:hypothetical protein
MRKTTRKNTSPYSTLNLTNHSLKPMKLREKILEAQNEMLVSRGVKKTYLRKDFYSLGKAWPASQGSGWVANNSFPFCQSFGQKRVEVWRRLVACHSLIHGWSKTA